MAGNETLAGMASCGRMIWAFCFLLLIRCGSEENDSPAPIPLSTTAKIMPLGDSITESTTGMPTYRFFLWHLAQRDGYRIDFVGSMHGAHDGPPSNTDFDMDHEGHWAWRADEVLAGLPEWAASASPDIVLLHIGHNDLCQGQPLDRTVNEISAIIDVLRTANPSVVILLAQNIASLWPCHAQMPEFIARLPALAAGKSTEQSPISLVNQNTGFDPVTMTWDGQHPNEKGESLIAERWFVTLRPLLDQRFGRSQ
jgi:GDSL-like Lipase/Acylhydrolase family